MAFTLRAKLLLLSTLLCMWLMQAKKSDFDPYVDNKGTIEERMQSVYLNEYECYLLRICGN